ncbi:NADH-quinone oxidoreductase subunit C [Azonexus fungiphilus]|uniref:NADH-quinone oxidoreductase subunit C n=1 Tax=Azonexus fungiphilus TaxID=146940 RepID=UPI00156A9C3B|nr:NADH-quinone oxidoreductase subunit C [Azonexus fungiphilus]NHC06116.1 NADH-quinone oxidoreductase subunit C [Azonexus fungiphilus]
MSAKLETLSQKLQDRFGDKLLSKKLALGELTVEVAAADYFSLMQSLRDEADFSFEELIDLCGVDYSTYGDGAWQGKRFAAVVHLLSIAHNVRLRVRVFADSDEFPAVDSVTSLWTSANWFEREAFDLYGIAFIGHEDLRRILTDYGFIGHPFRKDFPISGHVEMRYDPDQGRVVYQPVTIEPRENTPRIVREDTYGDPAHG